MSQTPPACIKETMETDKGDNDSATAANEGEPDEQVANPATIAPPKEELGNIDRQLDQLVSEMMTLFESRGNNMLAADRKGKLPCISHINMLQNYKLFRQRRYDVATGYNVPPPLKFGSSELTNEFTTYWDVNKTLSTDALFTALLCFFHDRANALQGEYLVVRTRWIRFCRTEEDLLRLRPKFMAYGERLTEEHNDVLSRYERLMEKWIAMQNPREPPKNPTPSKPDRKGSKNAPSLPIEDLTPPFLVSDLVVFLRWLISDSTHRKSFELFKRRLTLMLHSHRDSLCLQYVDLVKYANGDGSNIDPHGSGSEPPQSNPTTRIPHMPECMVSLPKKCPDPKTLLHDFGNLINQYAIVSSIDNEDGRAFAHEVENVFQNRFPSVIFTNPLRASADTTNADDNVDLQKPENHTENRTGGYEKANQGFGAKESQASFVTKKATWLKDKKLRAKSQEWQDAQQKKISKDMVEIDFELRYEYDLICSSDIESVRSRMWDRLKQWFAEFSEVAASGTRSTRNDMSPFSHSITTSDRLEDAMRKHSEENDPQKNVPLVSIEDGLQARLQRFNQLHQAFKAAQEFEHNTKVSKKEPNITAVFSQHELFAFFELRCLNMRELRETLLRQLNYYRSIQKRLVVDSNEISMRTKKFYSANAENSYLLDNLGFFDFSHPVKLADVIGRMNFKVEERSAISEDPSEMTDTAVFDREKITIRDGYGRSIIYDVAFGDLKQLENEMLRVATYYINKGPGSQAQTSRSYIEDLRTKLTGNSECGEESFLNPDVGRTSLLHTLLRREVEFQDSKIQLLKTYLEVYEHAAAPSKALQVAQTIHDLISLRPCFNDQAQSFDQYYKASAVSLELEKNIVTEYVNSAICMHRKWVDQRAVNDKSGSEMISPIKSGLPFMIDAPPPMTTMHGTGIREINVLEIMPHLATAVDLREECQSIINEFVLDYENISGETCNPVYASCVVWKKALELWREMAEPNLGVSSSGQILGSLDGKVLLENPLLPDTLLRNTYSPYGGLQGGSRTLNADGPQNTDFDDPAFQVDGCKTMTTLMKVLLLQKRLLYSWFETEYAAKVNVLQAAQLGIPRGYCNSRFKPMRLDEPDSTDPTSISAGSDETYSDDENDDDDFTPRSNISVIETQKMQGLAVVEIDDSVTFNFKELEGFLQSINDNGVEKLMQALKIQLIEKNIVLVIAEQNRILLTEKHSLLLQTHLAEQSLMAQVTGKESSTNSHGIMSKQNGTGQNIKNLLVSFTSKKKLLRKLMMTDYAAECSRVIKDEAHRTDGKSHLNQFKTKLFNWYYSNMTEAVTESWEKIELIKVTQATKRYLSISATGRALFKISKFKTIGEYMSADSNAQHPTADQFHDVQAQDVRMDKTSQKLCMLWYIPHPAEILGWSSERSPKGALSTSAITYQNSGLFRESAITQSFLFRIIQLIRISGQLLQENRKNVGSVKSTRMNEYVNQSINKLKKELGHLGNPVDYSRLLPILNSRWRLWYQKLRLMIQSSCWRLTMDSEFDASVTLWDTLRRLTERDRPDPRSYEHIAVMTNYPSVCSTFNVTTYCFIDLNEEQRKVCDGVILEVEDAVNSYVQPLSLSFTDNAEDSNKSQLSHIGILTRLYALRREFTRVTVGTEHIENENQMRMYEQIYKSRILTEAARLYYLQGSKGNASNAFLMRNLTDVSAVSDFNRVAELAFQTCQVSVLTSEIMKDYSSNIEREVELLMQRFVDERTGKLYKTSETVVIPSSLDSKFAYKLTEKDYAAKSELLNGLITGLMKQSASLTKDFATKKTTTVAISNDKMFFCTKEGLSQCIHHFAIELSRWHQRKLEDQEKYVSDLQGHLSAVMKQNSRQIERLQIEKSHLIEGYQRDVRLAGADRASGLAMKLALTSMELNELKKTRRVDEKRIRSKVVEEYDDLVRELSMQIHSLKMRFQEYRSSTLQDAFAIMSDTKKEELQVLVESPEYTAEIKQSAAEQIQREECTSELRDENHSLKTIILKLRAMSSIKDQTLRAIAEKKVLNLAADNKKAEEKLWDSYRESETREKVLRRQVSKLQTQLATMESELDTTKQQLQVEQTEREMIEKRRAAEDAESKLILTKLDRLKQYDGMDIESMLKDLTDQAHHIAGLSKELNRRENIARKGAKNVDHRVSSAQSSRTSPSRPSRPVSARSTASGAVFAGAGDELLDRLNLLYCENHRLRKMLEAAKIQVPPVYAKTAQYMMDDGVHEHQLLSPFNSSKDMGFPHFSDNVQAETLPTFSMSLLPENGQQSPIPEERNQTVKFQAFPVSNETGVEFDDALDRDEEDMQAGFGTITAPPSLAFPMQTYIYNTRKETPTTRGRNYNNVGITDTRFVRKSNSTLQADHDDAMTASRTPRRPYSASASFGASSYYSSSSASAASTRPSSATKARPASSRSKSSATQRITSRPSTTESRRVSQAILPSPSLPLPLEFARGYSSVTTKASIQYSRGSITATSLLPKKM